MKKTILLLVIASMLACSKKSSIRIWEEPIIIPTYEMGVPEVNPYFYVPSNYQGAQNRVYPYPFMDKISDKRIEKAYKGLFIENEYIKICVLPELGGRLWLENSVINIPLIDYTHHHHRLPRHYG